MTPSPVPGPSDHDATSRDDDLGRPASPAPESLPGGADPSSHPVADTPGLPEGTTDVAAGVPARHASAAAATPQDSTDGGAGAPARPAAATPGPPARHSRGDLAARWLPPTVALVVLGLWAWQRLGFLDPYLDVVLPEGTVTSQPNALTTVDHPWHAARFSLLLDALRDGHPLRWVASHQGGFPTEFNPVAAGLVDLVVWLLTLGQLPVPLVHTYAVGVTFLLPLVGFVALAAVSRTSIWAGVAAGAAHLCVRGWWWSGGSMELVEWGLFTNVVAATAMFLALPPLLRLLHGWSTRAAAGGGALVALGLLTNPRSVIAVVAFAVAALLSGLLERDLVPVVRRLLVPAALAVGLAAPVLVPLVRYRDLYYFVQYTGYADVEAWYRSSVQAVSGPVAVATGVGLVACLWPGAPRAAQVTALTLVVYAATTVALVSVDLPASLVDQLETTRLMPFQRLLMIAVAGLGLGLLLRRLPVPPLAGDGALAAVAAAVAVLYVAAPAGFVPESDRGLVRIGTYADASMVDLERAVRLADAEALPDTALLVLGSTVSWHAQLWAPVWTDRRLFYDDWLWYWQREHVGDYDPDTEHAYRSDASTLDPAYLAVHGVGAVVLTDPRVAAAADASPHLTRVSDGPFYDVYTVVDPSPVATLGDAPAVVTDDEPAELVVETDGRGGPLVVRTNWFPRWQATVDGRPVEIIHRPDGYIEVTVPPGGRTVALTYAVTALDWLVRITAALAALAVVGLLLPASTVRLGRRVLPGQGGQGRPPLRPGDGPPGA